MPRMALMWIILGITRIGLGMLQWPIENGRGLQNNSKSESHVDASFRTFCSYAQMFPDDYTMLSVVTGEGIITGGPLQL